MLVGDWQNCGGGGRKILDIPFHILQYVAFAEYLIAILMYSLFVYFISQLYLRHQQLFSYFTFSLTKLHIFMIKKKKKNYFSACFDTIYIIFGGINYTMRAFELAGSRLYTVTFPYVIYPFTNIGNALLS